MSKKLIMLVGVMLVAATFYILGGDYLTLDAIKGALSEAQGHYQSKPLIFALIYISTYAIIVSFYLPGPLFLNLLVGAVAGPAAGTVFALFGVTLGSLLAFMTARYFCHEWVENRFPEQSRKVTKAVKRSGWMYVTLMRLAPGIPVGLTNLLAGLSRINIVVFGLATLLGSIPWIIFYVLMGKQLMTMNSITNLLNIEILLVAGLLMALVLVSHWALQKMSSSKPV
ncbi:MAG: TVP38/TMEM64 family protein [Alphaproteobacteria bacterium]|nr:TVP38/TMEM64 family protein [Alphaproteobacteria bacterium]